MVAGMRLTYPAICMALFAMLSLYGTAYSQQAAINSTNINASINATAAYINKVNQSGYLIFYPNLQQAYRYLGLARNISPANASAAYYLLTQARQSAASQEASIKGYETYSLYVLLAAFALLAVLLYALMRPYKPTTKRRRAKRN